MKTKYPLSRKAELVVQDLDNEVLIYDLNKNKAFCLNETSALVWQLSDGDKSVSEIGRIISSKLNLPVDEDVVWFALDQLKKENLIENEVITPVKFNGLSRRQVIKRIGLGTLIALPVVSSLVAPTAAQAAVSACTSTPTCTCLLSNANMNGDSCGNGDTNTCNAGCTCTRNTTLGGCNTVGAMVFCPGACS